MMSDKLKLAAVIVASLGLLLLIALATAHTASLVVPLDRPLTVFEQRATVRAELSERK